MIKKRAFTKTNLINSFTQKKPSAKDPKQLDFSKNPLQMFFVEAFPKYHTTYTLESQPNGAKPTHLCDKMRDDKNPRRTTCKLKLEMAGMGQSLTGLNLEDGI